MAFRDGPAGIGGWLAFYLVTLGVISPLVAIVTMFANLYGDPQVAAAFGARWETAQAIEFALLGLNLALLYFVVWRFFFRRVWQTVRIAIAVMWTSSVVLTGVEIGLISWLGGFDPLSIFKTSALEFIKPLGYCAIWTAYLLRSVRVENTYPKAQEDEGLTEVFE